MTVAEAREQALKVKEFADADDDEQAHGWEDSLHQEVLVAVAEGHPDSVELARIALGTVKIKFSRWCT